MLANSGAITFTLTNPTTTVPLVIDVAASSLTGTNAADFVVDNTGLANGTSTIKFTPSASGVRTAVLSVISNAKAKSPYIINLTGTGVKLSQTLTFNTLNAKSTTDAPFDLAATSTSTLPITYTSSNASVATISGKTVTIVGVGTSTITASQVGDVNYSDATPVTQTLTVNTKQSQTITFAALTAKKFGDATFTLAATASSALAVTYISSNPNVATISGSTVTITGVGTSTITASQAGNATFNPATDVAQTLTVNKGDQTITFGTLSPKVVGDASFDLTAASSSSLAVSYASTNTAVATMSGKTVTIVGAGNTTITASQGGNANYNAASDVTQILTVSKVNQTITFVTISTKAVGDPAFTLTATASSSLAVSYSTTTATKISISGSQVTLVAAGQATVKGSQAGNTSYHAAADVSQTFCINPAKPVVTVSGVNTETLVLTSSSAAGNQWFLNGTAIAGATNLTLSAAQEGVYKVQATIEGCVSAFSDNQTFIVTGDLSFATQSSDILLYPNPTSDWLTISLPDLLGKKVVSIYQQDGKRTDVKETMGREVVFQVGEYAQGIYLVKVVTGKSNHIIRFTKK